jgi:hypothetical protein
MLPRTHFEPLVLASTFGLSSIVGLADLFDASVQASAYRFASLWPEPTLVLTLEMGLRKEELDDPMAQKKLRVVSAWPYPRGAWIYIPKNKSADEQGSLARAFAGEHVDERAGLEELGLQSPGRLELSARAFTYRSMDGPRRRVVALFRQTEGSING